MTKMLQHKKASAWGDLECGLGLVLMYSNNAFIQELVAKVNACAALNNLQMPDPPRTSRAAACLRDTQTVKDIAPCTGQQWQCGFFPAVDTVTAELDCRVDQPGMKLAAQREKTMIDAVKGLYSG